MYGVVQDTIGRWTSAQVHDTVAAIARQRIYAPARRSVISRFISYVFERIGELFDLIRTSPSARLLVIASMVAVAIVVVARIVAARRVDASHRGRHRAGRAGVVGEEAWSAARAAASAGDYTNACHLLYAAVLEALARDGAVKRHVSKTSGDYVRELRARGAPSLREFREFTGDFDRVIYGHGEASATDFDRLSSAAERAVRVAPAA